MKRTKKIILGLVIIVLGLIWGLNATGVTDIDIFFDGWWTLFIIVPSLSALFSRHDKWGGLIGLLIGVALLLDQQDVFGEISIWQLLVPAAVVLVGIKILINAVSPKNKRYTLKNFKGDIKRHSVFFSGDEIAYKDTFTGGTFSAVFGGIECDLSEAKIEKDVVIDATAVFGGVEITLPVGVGVKVNSTSLFGGIDAKKCRQTADVSPMVYINGTCIFGGIEIK